ncbi:MAG: SH3 domain-containing protein [Alistipes sp.]|nr:SH3 domain-containing protein [Alistipes sp.]
MKHLLTPLLSAMLLVAASITTPSWASFDNVHIYGNGYDGFINLRERASTKSRVVTIIPNGFDYAELIDEDHGWYYVLYNGNYGYVSKSQTSTHPTPSVNLNITAKWLAGSWYYNDNILTLDANGNCMYKDYNGKNHAAKWRLSGGNDITIKASWDDWQGVYTIDLYNNQIGPYTRTHYTPSTTPTPEPIPAPSPISNADIEYEQSLAIHKAIWSSFLTDQELMTILYDSSTGAIPEEFSWILGEWHAEKGGRDFAVITANKIRTYDSSTGIEAPAKASDVKASEYIIRYMYNTKFRRYFLAIAPKGDIPPVYITQYGYPDSMFYIHDEVAVTLERVGDAEINSSISIGLISIIAAVLAAIVGTAILFAVRRK